MPRDFLRQSVWITSNNCILEEYKTEIEDENTIRCYIPSQAGDHFQIRWEDRTRHRASLVACYMDGRPVGGVPSRPNSQGCNDGVPVSESRVKLFTFSSVITTDDEDVADPDGVDVDLGCIQVEFHRISIRLNEDTTDRQYGQVHTVGPVHERSKKLGAHCVSLGEELETQEERSFVAPKLLDRGPYAIFKFIYRPRELLLARGIIPPVLEDPSKLGIKAEEKPEPAKLSTRPPESNLKLAASSRTTDVQPRLRARKQHSGLAPVPITQYRRLTARQRKILARNVKAETKDAKDEIKEEPAASSSNNRI
ncbi:hypothetical protein BDW22DRAFT_1354051 [Trametopsis cervina]|nr:hypothetical protein BDW22DRAFT_1354051 [Trametopsis cervina]